MTMFGDLIPKCCLARKFMVWKWYRFWGHFHGDGDNSCMHCGMPAYKKWDHKYNGYLGFCTRCDISWSES